MSDTALEDDQTRQETPPMRRTVAGACIGTVIEYFDYGSYGYLAATLAVVFFPGGDPALATIQTWAIFALSFIMRPLGGLFWGHFGDRIGRTRTLSMTILAMGVSTAVVGLLPGYSVIGIWAPILLLLARMCQSFCAAGEYSGAAVLLGEHAPPARRARYVSFIPIGNAAGLLIASLLTTGLYSMLGTEAVQSWGWRIPFLLGVPLTLIGWYIRRKIDETPDFLELQGDDARSEAPVLAGLREHWKTMLRLVCVMGVNAGAYYLVLSYMASYIEQEVHLSSFYSSLIVTIGLVLYLPALYLCASLADKVGRKPVLIANSILFLTLSYPAFLLLGQNGFVTALIVQILMTTMFALNDSTFATFFIESFPAKVRFSGFAIPFNFGVALFGGTTPLLASWLIDRTGVATSPAFIVMAIAALCLGALLLSPETSPENKSR
ncbi:MFS transporter [Streptomyces sp. NPDC046805]|uniref:MFS transporter n=1 Tax=Streptomyces sp. NPDC046805 TaxID=3155134 RepID=UPI0033C2811E